jgi:DNA-binding NarL/FixJ family response regulator
MEIKQKNKIKILLVDNDEMMRIYFQDVFWVHGDSEAYEINMVSSLEEAEKRIMNKDTKPDTIFLDIMMSNIKGKEGSPSVQLEKSVAFVEKIKKDKDLSSIKIIIYSSQKEKVIKNIFHKMGVDGYLIKGELMPKEIVDFTDKIHESNNKN